MARRPTDRSPGPGGCLALIAFFVIEIAAGIAAAALCYPVAAALMLAIVPAREREFGEVCAIILCFVPGFAAMWAIDKLCRRVTGHSVLDNIPYIP